MSQRRSRRRGRWSTPTIDPDLDEDLTTTSRFRVVPDRSAVMINARSSVGPITFGAIGVTGVIEATVGRSTRVLRRRSRLLTSRSTSSNCAPATASTTPNCCAGSTPDAIRPSASTCAACTELGSTGRYQLQGEVTFHGVSRPLDGTVSVAMPCEHTLVVRGEQVVDIRDFGVASPTVLMLRIYPDVVVGIQIEAELDEQPQPADQ